MITRISVRAHLDWIAQQPSTAVLFIRVAEAPGQLVAEEDLQVDNAEVEEFAPQPTTGARPLRLHASTGTVRLRYAAQVQLSDAPFSTDVELPTLAKLDLDLQPWTLASRYCPADLLAPTAEHLFGHLPRTGALLEQVRAWVEANIDYVPGTSDVHTAADETMLQRTGVCRDMAHLTATLLRGLGIPARLVAAYALDLEPPDFHAVVEAHDGQSWRLLDATGLAPINTLARIVTGRDAADIAWGTTEGPMELTYLQVTVDRA